MHLNAVGGDCPKQRPSCIPDVLRAAKDFVGIRAANPHRGRHTAAAADHPVTELWRVLAAEAARRRSASDVTVFDSVGFALEDYAAFALRPSTGHGRKPGHEVELIAHRWRPKDLFGRTRGDRQRVALRRVA